MSKRFTGWSTRKPSNPVPWEGAGLGLDAATRGGRPYEAILEAFPGATPFEYDCAMILPPYPGSWLPADDAVARVGSLRQARRGRPDLSESDWQQCVRLLYPTLSEQQRQNPQQLLTSVAALRPLRSDNAPADPSRWISGEAVAALAPGKPGRPGWRRRGFEEHWEHARGLAEDPTSIAEVAFVFVALDGAVGITPEHLRSLRRRWRRGELPE